MRNRRNNPLRGKPKVAVVVDGETEAWYLTMLNRNEPNAKFQIKPEIPQIKSLSDQFDKVQSLAKDYDTVVWMIDLDVILKETREVKKGQPRPLDEFLKYKGFLDSVSNVTVIINQPCMEFWLLLHFEFTQAPFEDCARAEKRLVKHLTDYVKIQKYYTKEGDAIYLKLKEKLPIAIGRTKKFSEFDPENPDRGHSGMHKFFGILGLS
ncbi:RloB family protein [Algoriphagus halophytocola]|uniref:RloB family protein n=1 Tax=Algoriphagus halophytocola TaxID=2991499 RepID=A0ABY6MIE8_9BACT|nr:RloB family protein [Algoriphagus sp. TR-M5]UZD22963.1 RloB family protein [Algoriphagus sp. TR-M5]